MPSLRCGHCEKLFEYREKIIALRETGAAVVAERETELEAGTVEGAFQPVGKFHLDHVGPLRAFVPRSGERSSKQTRRATSERRESGA